MKYEINKEQIEDAKVYLDELIEKIKFKYEMFIRYTKKETIRFKGRLVVLAIERARLEEFENEQI